jgi:hypothetical protein
MKPCPINIYNHVNLPSFADKVRAKRCSGIGVIRGDVLLVDDEHYTVCHYNADRNQFVCTNGVSTRFVALMDVYRGTVARYRTGKRLGLCTLKFTTTDLGKGERFAAENMVRSFRLAYMRGHQPDINHD